jgi:hypothetical protein
MARELLRPEDATTWDDFLDRIAEERSVRSCRRGSAGSLCWESAGALLLGVSLVAFTYAAGADGVWWEWLVVLAPLAALVRMAIVATERAERNDERLKELDQLELGWKSHLERPRH